MQHASTIILNGAAVSAEEARIPLSDRGFRYGDGLFETIRLIAAVPYQWGAHMERLAAGMKALRIEGETIDWRALAQRLIKENGARDGMIRIAVSRGSGGSGYLPSESMTPTTVLEWLPPRPLPEKPYRVWLSTPHRAPLSVLPGNHKLAQALGSTLALLEAKDQGCDEALQFSTDGYIACAASANFFWVAEGKLFTPALSTGCLAGTMRGALLKLMPIREALAQVDALEKAEAVFVSNARLGIWPVSEIAPLDLKFDVMHPLIEQVRKQLVVHAEQYYLENKADWKSNS